jgi:hypothetical protein
MSLAIATVRRRARATPVPALATLRHRRPFADAAGDACHDVRAGARARHGASTVVSMNVGATWRRTFTFDPSMIVYNTFAQVALVGDPPCSRSDRQRDVVS